MFPLMAIGAGIGQGMQQIQQQQESAMRQQAAQEQLKQLLQARQVEELLGSVARSGGKIPGFGGLNLPGTQMQQLPGMQQQPMMPPPQSAGANYQAVRGPMPPPGQIDPYGSPAPPGYEFAPGGKMHAIRLGGASPSGPVPIDAGGVQSGSRFPLDDDPETMRHATEMAAKEEFPATSYDVAVESPQSPAGIETPGAGEVGGPAAASPGAAADQAQQSYDISSPTELSQYLGMFHAADPSAIAKHISSVRPDASDGAVWRATATLMKMAGGNMREQLASASMMKFLLGEQGKNARFERKADQTDTRLAQGAADITRKVEQGNRRADQTDTRLEQGRTAETRKAEQGNRRLSNAEDNTRLRKENIDRLSAQSKVRAQQNEDRLLQARSAIKATDRRTALNGLLRDIEKQLYPGFGAIQPTDEEKAVLMEQRNQIVNELRWTSGMDPLPVPPPSAAGP